MTSPDDSVSSSTEIMCARVNLEVSSAHVVDSCSGKLDNIRSNVKVDTRDKNINNNYCGNKELCNANKSVTVENCNNRENVTKNVTRKTFTNCDTESVGSDCSEFENCDSLLNKIDNRTASSDCNTTTEICNTTTDGCNTTTENCNTKTENCNIANDGCNTTTEGHNSNKNKSNSKKMAEEPDSLTSLHMLCMRCQPDNEQSDLQVRYLRQCLL